MELRNIILGTIVRDFSDIECLVLTDDERVRTLALIVQQALEFVSLLTVLRALDLRFQLGPSDTVLMALLLLACYASDLAIVVSDFPPKHIGDPATFKKPKAKVTFDASTHTTVPTIPNSGTILRRPTDDNCNLYLLHDKQDGLCRLAQLPTKADTRIVYYSEWVSKEHFTQHS
ncbi:hypothetical protein EDB80DRAFT_864439 [Ilyonectria destructans]|nr:hypothetical protein EDB80DRAFT_864439 [Ilyonectria destructans]